MEQTQTATFMGGLDEQVVVFQLGSESYGIGISLVQEIKTMSPVTSIPQAPPYVEGVINFRGRVTPVVDMRARFGLARAEHTKETRIIVVSAGEVPVGLIVDSVSEVLRVPGDSVESPSELVATVESDFIRGIAKLGEERLIILLDLERMLRTTSELAARLAA